MAGPVVHVGYHKTATSWLQTACFPNATNARMVPRGTVADALITSNALTFSPSAARAAVLADAGAGERAIVSHEGLLGNPHVGGYLGFHTEGLIRRVRATLPDARIMIVLRNQFDILPATYKQYVRAGGTHGVRRYLYGPRRAAPMHKMPRFAWGHFDYDTVVGAFESLYGRDNVHVFLYEELRDRPERFFDRLAGEVGLTVDRSRISRRSENVGLKWATLALSRLLHHFTDRNVPDKRCVLRLLPSHRPVKAALTPINGTPLGGPPVRAGHLLDGAIRADIAARYGPGNARLAARRGLDLAGYGYPVAGDPAA